VGESAGADGAVGVLAERVIAAIRAPLDLAGAAAPLRPGVSLGLTVFPDDPSGPDQLLRHADAALYQAKAAGRGTWRAHAHAAAAAGDGTAGRVGGGAIDGLLSPACAPC
jgi:predicted signal transduction protein with EAL and GGDEF domain